MGLKNKQNKHVEAKKPLWEKLLPWGIVIVVLLFIGINSSINRNAANNNPQETAEHRQAREKEEALAMEEQKARQARDYCAARVEDSSEYYVIKLREEKNGDIYTNYDNSPKKAGYSLTQTDCREIIDALYKWKSPRIEEIIQRVYWIGMDKFGLIVSIGIPNDINSSNYGSGSQEQWVYYKDSYGIRNTYIYLNEEDKVTSYQDF